MIYRSSAGSGKTYTLTKEYLKLALTRNGYYKHILAVTFTNKAMQEMKNRIIQKLDEFSRGECDAMAEELMLFLGLDKDAFQHRCKTLLTEILHGYSHFAISTIDAFFQKVIRSFAKELGLAGSYRLELNHTAILIQIVDDLLLEVTDNKQIRDWLIRYARESLQDGSNWDVRKSIRQLAQEIFAESFKGIEEEVATQDKNLPQKLKASVDAVLANFEKKMHKLGCDGLEIIARHGLLVTDFRGGSAGVAHHLNKICKDQGEYEPTKTLLAVIEGSKSWYPKNSDNAVAIDAALADGLEAIFEEAIAYYRTDFKKYATALQVKQFVYGYGLLADLTRKLQEYKKEHDVMLISDATSFLKELVKDSDTPFVYEKVGSFYKHYLIDEFQDTSGFQWDSFRPLVEDSLAQGHKNLVVGDIKQSIYRWRGGDWELLLKKIQNDIGENRTSNMVLDTNFRSENNIIQFNNSLFQLFPKALVDEGGKESSETLDSWNALDRVYEDTYQKVPEKKAKDAAGYVNITFLQDEKDWKYKEQVAEKLPVIIEELQDKGVPLKDIAILVRFNKEGKQVVDFLSAYEEAGKAKPGYRYDVVSNESLFLVTSPTVRVIIAAIRYLHDKKDKIVKAELLYEYQKVIKKSEVPFSDLLLSISSNGFEQWLPKRFLEDHHKLLYLPFYELVETLIDIFEANTIQGQFAYLQTFQDLVLKFSQNEKGDIASFLEWWEERAPKESIKVADDLDAIRILTIHKAKGLEFPAVIVPFCDWNVDHKNRTPIVWTETNQDPFNVGHLPIRYKSALAQTYYDEAYQDEKAKAHLDSLNLLYVVFTRAVHNLWVLAPERKKSISNVMRTVISDKKFELNEHWDEQKNVFEYGNRAFHFERAKTPESVNLQLEGYQHFNWRNRITVRQSAENFATADDTRTKINYGILMHKLLSKIRVLEDKKRAVQALYYEEGLNETQKKEMEQLLDRLLQNDQAKAWFCKDWKVYNEMTILTPEKEYRPDRVIAKKGCTVIIDYKTGVANESDKNQMGRYKSLLQEMGYLNIKAFLWYLGDNKVVEV